MTSSWFFLSTLNYDARSTTHHMYVFEFKMCFDCVLQLLSKKFLKIRSTERDIKKCILVFLYSTHFSSQSLLKFEFRGRFFEKIFKYQIS